MQSLADQIRHHQYLYYVKNQPEISDQEFDFLYQELLELEKKHPELKDPYSPTLYVGSDLSNEFQKVTHRIPVLSLENTYNQKELEDWISKTDPNALYSLEWKIDGASIVLYYEKGILVQGVTRGAGGIGDDVTENVKTIRSIPIRLPQDVTIYVRGEVYMTTSDFETYNKKLGGKFANPRNLAAGTLKHKNPQETGKRPLRIFTYDGFFPDAKGEFANHSDILQKMEELQLPTLPDTQFLRGLDIHSAIQSFRDKKDSVQFPVDGLVIKLNDLARREELGYTSHSPRWARAYKFDATWKETKVVAITYAVGRTGKITPRAEIEPVLLAGTKVTFATLHNQDYIDELGVGIGARVMVAKRGEIIPAVEKVVEPGESIFQIPPHCPSCGSRLAKKQDSVDIFCLNDECPDRRKNLLIFYCERKQMDIEGLGEKQIRFLYDNQYIQSIPDLYDLHKKKGQLVEEIGFGSKSVQIILDGIEESKQKPFRYLLPAIGLPEIGHKVSELLIENGYASFRSILSAVKKKNAKELFESIDGIGPIAANAICEQFQSPKIQELIQKLQKAGLQTKADKGKATQKGDSFEGQSWCVTGSFQYFQPREKAMQIISDHGGKTVGSVSSKTTHLLAGEGAGSKLEKARKAGTKIVTEEEFLDLLAHEGIPSDSG